MFRTVTKKGTSSLDTDCNNKCVCTRATYDPICGVDGVQYFSPCHAGCDDTLTRGRSRVRLTHPCFLHNINIFQSRFILSHIRKFAK